MKKIYGILLLAFFASACGGHAQTDVKSAADLAQEAADARQKEQSEREAEGLAEEVSVELEDLTTWVDWPELGEEENYVYSIESRIENGGVGVQARALIRKPLEQLIKHIEDPDIMAPLHMEPEYAILERHEDNGHVFFDMRIKVRFIMSIEYIVTWQIAPITVQDTVVGYTVGAQKTSGSSHLKEMSYAFLLRPVDEETSRLEFTSFTRATMDKEDEARQYIEDVLERLALAP